MNSTDRLKILHRQEQRNRKFVCVMNDVTRNHQDRYCRFVDKEKQESVQNCNKSIVLTRKHIVRQRVLKQCMKETREEMERRQATKLYGRYHGVPMENIAAEVEPFLERHHPRVRRQQKIDRLVENGHEHGGLMDDDTIQEKMKSYFSRPLVHVVDSNEQHDDQTSGPVSAFTFPNLTKPFYTGNCRSTPKTTASGRSGLYETIEETEEPTELEQEATEEKLFVIRNNNKFPEDDARDDISVQSETPKSLNLISTTNRELRPITLPPIKLGVDRPDRSKKSTRKPKSDCISELIEKIHNAKATREREIKLKKEQRTKRLLADKVKRNGVLHSEDEKREREEQAKVMRDWEEYEQSFLAEKKKVVPVFDPDRNRRVIEKGRMYLPPIKVIQRPVLLK